MADGEWLRQNYPSLEIRKRASPLRLRGLGTKIHESYDYVLMPLHFLGEHIDRGTPAIASFTREVSIVDNLNANMLLGMDSMGPEGFDIFNSKGYVNVDSCRVRIPMETKSRGKPVKARVLVAEHTTVPPRSTISLPVEHRLHEDDSQDLIFTPASTRFGAYALFTNVHLDCIFVENHTSKPMILPKRTFVGHLCSMDPDCRVHSVGHDGDAASAAYHGSSDPTPSSVSAKDFTTHNSTGANVFSGLSGGDGAALSDFLDRNADIFQDDGFANVPPDEWLKVRLRDNWQDMIPKKCRVYPMTSKDSEIVDRTLTKLQEAGKIERTRQSVPFSFPVFVVWRTMSDGTRKGRMVIDVRGLNRMSVPDAYPMKSQDDILARITNAKYITVLDATAFFYQWRLHPESAWMFTITTARGQFTFKCAIMGYHSSPAYVQRQMDRLLEGTPGEAYSDDLVVPTDGTLEDHLRDVGQVFARLREANIAMGPKKSFFAAPTAVVLGRYVDSFGLSTTEERLQAVKSLEFPKSLKDLEHFIGLAGYMRHNVPRFAMKIAPLEARKTNLLRLNAASKPKGKMARQGWTNRILFTLPSEAEKVSFDTIKSDLTTFTSVVHFNPERRLFVDFDVSASGIGVQVYHVNDDTIPKLLKDGRVVTYPPRTSVQTIAYLSRSLSDAERRYWATEMEILGCVWVLKKCARWIKLTKHRPTLCTDHSAIVSLSKQPDIVNSTAASVNNKKLICALEFMSGFEIDFLHKPGRENVVPDALSRLPSPNTTPADAPGGLEVLPDDHDELWSFLAEVRPADPLQPSEGSLRDGQVHVEMSPEFRKRIQEGYKMDPRWARILDMIHRNDALGVNKASLPFEIRFGLVWKTSSEDGTPRLCVPRSCVPEILELAHAGSHHGYARLSEFLRPYFPQRLPDLPQSRIRIHDALALAAMTVKAHFDRRHLAKFFNVGERVLLRLHKGYGIPMDIGRKYGPQYAGPFRITERIGRSAYRLDFPRTWKLRHDVVSVDHLEPCPMDPFGRALPGIGPIRVEDHERRLLSKRTAPNGTTKYLVEYVGLGPEFREWRTLSQLGDKAEALLSAFTRDRLSIQNVAQ
ncbi:hypothetical protein DHEL01_v206213 [Diaporthe helianthi]|uniref:Reverse transcriptase n=1 Tax=Diaporthe helianthi TaxID=158607 RepID=A0A2P5HYQ8_DIAHE|nr:hypothetical protein DHEL01_v206213 [Diaporthe helianthi]